MIHLEAEALGRSLPYPELIDALRAAFAEGWTAPARHHHQVQTSDGTPAKLLLMPAWRTGQFIGVKLVNVFAGNTLKNMPAVSSLYILCDGSSGRILAQIDGECLTARRTAAASALAASFLARRNAHRLLIVGAGRIAAELAVAHAAVRPISHVTIWSRTAERAKQLEALIARQGFEARITRNLQEAVGEADVISCATLSNEPLIRGDWLQRGTHIDLIGSFTPEMRETDDAAIRRGLLIADCRTTVLAEAGDVIRPIRSGAIHSEHVVADLYDLCQGRHDGRKDEEQITIFKSVGLAIEDLAAASKAYTCSQTLPQADLQP